MDLFCCVCATHSRRFLHLLRHRLRPLDQRLDLLRAGGSDWPHELVAPLGADLTDPSFWQEGLGQIEALIERAETVANQEIVAPSDGRTERT